MSNDILSRDFRETPFWSDGMVTVAAQELPRRVDVAIVGAGLTGLSAAHRLASAGRDVVVLDAAEPGMAASSRNGGMLGKAGRQSLLLLSKAVGEEKAVAFFQEQNAIFQESVSRIKDEQLDCDFRMSGRFIGALSQKHYDGLAREYEARGKLLGEDYQLVPGSAAGEMASECYFGGVVVRENAALNPAKYTRAMLERAQRAGARIIGHARVGGLERKGSDWTVHVGRQSIVARDVLIATNGYSDDLVPWLNRRLLPINAYMVATEELPQGLAREILPHNRTYIDNTRATRYMQLSADGKRLLYGAKTGRRPIFGLKRLAREIHRDMRTFMPLLRDVKLTHAWTGRCAATWDFYPHLGTHEGLHYALGYCFGGLLFAPYLGRKAAERILQSDDQATAYARDFPEVPLQARIMKRYTTPIAARYYAWADRPQPKS
ncbi:FAD-binding oxidoreductase [Brucella tritici]|uniref:FAD-binding oxidoreductase n=1 Tax=Brucella tritici TaxID=94626 RepID=A0A7V7VW14_9HYPH|nr:FAD-binding oxidoreductase [Brucella tritici]KAB2658148.1 FAD-binding oxidoreductase [Brucella tritici]